MDRATVRWTLVAFFGASLAFRLIRSLTAGSSTLTTLAVEAAALVAILALVALFVRRRPRG